MGILYVLVAVLCLLFMITVHEVGHYLAAKLLKFRVNEFAIGFGKAIYKHTNKKTGEVFSLRMVPLGGFCAFEGEGDAGAPGAKITNSPKTTPDGKPIIPFNDMHPWKRLVVLFMGAFFNFICAVIFSFILVLAIGYYQTAKISSIDPMSHLHGTLKSGDVIREIDGERFTFLNNYQQAAAKYDVGETFTLTVERNGGILLIPVAKQEIKPIDEQSYWGLGVSLTLQYEKCSFGDACGKAWVFSGEMAWMILKILGKMVTFQMSLSQMGGTFSTIQVMSEAVGASMLNLLILIPLISVNLAVFNLLPIPALDGARMVFVAIEWIRKKPVDQALENRIHTVGLFVLLGLILLLDLNYLVIQRFFK
jgi:regulator of sigma E protease